jgi:hypothetical protein
VLGLSGDARVHISAPGIDVVITGDPEQVRSLLGIVKYELERNARWKERRGPAPQVAPAIAAPAAPPADAPRRASTRARRPGGPRGSQMVLPTELDEMDSPYALPDALVMPVEDTTGEHERETPGERAARDVTPREADRYITEPATVVPERAAEPSVTGPSVYAASRGGDGRPPIARLDSPFMATDETHAEVSGEDGPEREITAVVPPLDADLPMLHGVGDDPDETKETTPRGT